MWLLKASKHLDGVVGNHGVVLFVPWGYGGQFGSPGIQPHPSSSAGYRVCFIYILRYNDTIRLDCWDLQSCTNWGLFSSVSERETCLRRTPLWESMQRTTWKASADSDLFFNTTFLFLSNLLDLLWFFESWSWHRVAHLDASLGTSNAKSESPWIDPCWYRFFFISFSYEYCV